MRKNADLSSYLKSVNPIFSIFSCQFVVTECVRSVIHGKNKSPTYNERYLVVASPGVFLLKTNNFLPGINMEKIFPFVSITRMEVNPDCIIISQSKTNSGSDDSQIIFKTVNQVNIAYKIHTIRDFLYGNTALPYEIKIDPSIINDFTRQKYIYNSSSKIVDIFLSCALVYDHSKLQIPKLDSMCSLLNQIQEFKTFEINSVLMKKPYLASFAATISIDNDINEVRICDINLGLNQFQKLLISILQRTKSIKRLIFIHTKFEESDFSQFIHFMQSNPTFCGDEWIFDSCDFSKPEQSKFDKFFSSFKNYQRPVRILTFNRCHFSLTMFEKVVRDILFSNCFHSLEILWITNIEYPDVVLSFLIQLISSDLLIKVKKLNTLSIIDCCINLSDLFEKMVKLNSNTIINSTPEETGLGVLTTNFSGNSFWSPVTDKLWVTLHPRTNLILRKCTFSDESLASLFHALSLHKGKSLHLDCSGIAVSENGWLIFRKEIMGEKNEKETIHLSQKNELKPICLNTLTELVWDNNVIDSNNVKSFTNFLKEQHQLRKLSINDCINVHSALKRIKSFAGKRSSSFDEGSNDSKKRSLISFYTPRSSEIELDCSELQTNDDNELFEKELNLIIRCFVDFAKSCKLISFRIRSNFKSTCIGPKLLPLLEQLLKSQKLRVLDIFGQNIGDDNLEKVINLIPKSLEEFIFDGNSSSIEKLHNLLDQIGNASHENFVSFDDDQITLNLKKVNFPDNDVKKCLEKTPSAEKNDFQANFNTLKKEYSKLFQPSDYIDDQNIKNNKKSKNNLTDEFNNVELDYALSKINQYQTFSMKSDVDLDDENDDNSLSENDSSMNENTHVLARDDKLLKRKKISSITISLGSLSENQFLHDQNDCLSSSLNDEETKTILDECGLSGSKNDPMKVIMEKFSSEFSFEALSQKIEMTDS